MGSPGPELQITALEYRRIRRVLAAQNQRVNRTTVRQARERLRDLEAEAIARKDRLGRAARRAWAIRPVNGPFDGSAAGAASARLGRGGETEPSAPVAAMEPVEGLPDL